MSKDAGRYSPRRAGQVVGVSVVARQPRPVRIALFKHPHTYEVAWVKTDDGPVVVDLRIVAADGAPITSRDLRRVPVERLAKVAALYDTPANAKVWRELAGALSDAFADADPTVLVAGGLAWLEEQGAADVAETVREQVADRGASVVLADSVADVETHRFVTPASRPRTPKGKAGRPTEWGTDFLARVADWARLAAKQGDSVYPRVIDRASRELDCDVSKDQVKHWIRQCKREGLLAADELRPPRRRRQTRTAKATTTPDN